MQRKTVGLVVVAVRALRLLVSLVLLRLPTGDERGQPVDVAVGRGIAVMGPRLVVLRLVLLMLRKRLRVARNIGLRLARAEGLLALTAHRRLIGER